jgi:hypothetical protein
MKANLAAVLVIGSGLGVCPVFSKLPAALAQSGASQLAPLTTKQQQPLTLNQVRNATFQIPLLGQVTLTNGTYRAPGNVVVTMSQQMATGDVNQDGVADAVTVLRVTEANRKPTFYLAAVVNQAGKPVNVATVSLAQGFAVKSLAMKNRQVTVKLLKYAPNDAPCCPSQLISQSYLFNTTSGELLATSMGVQNPNQQGRVVEDVSAPSINTQINSGTFEAPESEMEVQF